MRRYRGFSRDDRATIVDALLERDGAVCRLCEGGPLDLLVRDDRHPVQVTIDHIHPVGDGGDHGAPERIDNLQLAHLLCNGKRAQSGDHEPLWFACELKTALDNWPKPSKRDRKLEKKARALDHIDVV